MGTPIPWIYAKILKWLPFSEQSYKGGNLVYSATSMKVSKPIRDTFALYEESAAHLFILVHHLESTASAQ